VNEHMTVTTRAVPWAPWHAFIIGVLLGHPMVPEPERLGATRRVAFLSRLVAGDAVIAVAGLLASESVLEWHR